MKRATKRPRQWQAKKRRPKSWGRVQKAMAAAFKLPDVPRRDSDPRRGE